MSNKIAKNGSRRTSTYKAHVYAVGYLDKKGATAISRSHRRYFVLIGEVMAYYLSKEQFDTKESQVGAIPLSQATDVWAKGKVISLKTHYRTYVFTAHEEAEAEKWTKALREAISRFVRQANERPKDKAKIATAAILGDIRVTKLKAQVEKTESELESVVSAKKAVDGKLESTLDELAATSSRLADTAAKLQSTSAALSETEASLSTANSNIESLQGDLTETKGEVSSLKSTLKNHDRTNMLKIAVAKTITDTHDHKAKETIDTLHNELAKLTEDLTTANVNISDLSHENQVKADKLAKLGDAYAARKAELAAANELIKKLTTELNDKKMAYNDLKQAKGRVDAELSTTQGELVAAKDTIATTKAELQATQETLHTTEDKLVEANANIADLKSELSTSEANLNDANRRILSTTEMITSLKENFNDVVGMALTTLSPPNVEDEENAAKEEALDEDAAEEEAAKEESLDEDAGEEEAVKTEDVQVATE